MKTGRIVLCLWFMAVWVGHAAAQAPNPILSFVSQVKDLEFPPHAQPIAEADSTRMAIYKPEGAGPFPAIVLLHQCGGMRNGAWQNLAMVEWAREAVKRGYVALLMDSFDQRGVTSVCLGAQKGMTFFRGVRDVLQGAEHLRKFDFVDKKRIALAGYSWGAMTSLLASSRQWGPSLAPGERFNAAVAFYPGCFTIRPPNGTPYEIVTNGVDRPVLVLMGEEDNETPPSDCVSRLESAKAAGAPVQWHVYPAATHCWDCRNLNGFTKTDFRGTRVTYRYDDAVTTDAAQRMFTFLEQHMPAGK